MSFISILEHIGNGIRVGAQATAAVAPIISLFPWGGLVLSTAAGLEAAIPRSNFGPGKRAATIALVTQSFPDANPVEVGKTTDEVVATLNKEAQKIVK